MIDTVKLKIRITNEDLKVLKRSGGMTIRSVLNKKDGKKMSFVKDVNGYIPSYDNSIRWFWDNKAEAQNILWLTFNPSKLYYGHNLFRVNQQQFYEMLSYIHGQFSSVYGLLLEEPVNWEIGTIDLSVTFKIKDYSKVLNLIKVIQAIDTEIVKNNKYETTAYFKRSDYFQFKVYDKYSEFKANDFYKISVNDKDRAEELWKFSKGIVAVEFRINQKVFKGIFGREVLTVKEFINIINLKDIIQKLIDKYLPEEAMNKVVDKRKVFDLLKSRVGVGEAIRLFNYYKLMSSQEGTMENWIWHYELSRQMRSKVRKELMGLGLKSLLLDEVKEKRVFDLDSDCYLGSPSNNKALVKIRNTVNYVQSFVQGLDSGESY